MWSSMFELDVSVWEKLIRTALLYAFLIVALRLSGKRLMAQLTTFDFILLLLVSNTVQNGLIGDDNTVSGAIIGAVALFALNAALAYVMFRSPRAQKLVAGDAVVVVRDGKPDEAALRRQRFTHSDLKIALQDAGVPRLKDVKRARLEPNGQLLVHVVEHDGPTRAELFAAVEELNAKVDRLTARLGDGKAGD
ncbi:DUF421 domain-containing protein [Agromyces sp. H3Y2-19a]|uniref:DUF421 domain-containing protein n=1 Tax=Agromyces chromiiresistens TaxID=3030835 RepID=UPI0023B94A10|nr:YetF domain-containing protein [Agromyces chromiiresistens]MDF0514188.1 DUF421 domain-containing protein [Agromyces chromiiresistens]